MIHREQSPFKGHDRVLPAQVERTEGNIDEIVQHWSASSVTIADTEAEAERIARRSKFFGEDSAIYGTPEQVVEAFRARAVAACQHFQIRFADFPSTEGVARFGREVLPKFK